ncbi:MAG: DoxX family protein [Caldilineaceae bacterium]
MKQSTVTTKVVTYWITTSILAFVLFSGGVGELTHNWGTLETVTILGYPTYFLTIIGVWKLLGAIALLAPRLPRLKEWVYAGIFFNMTGAALSHAAMGDYGSYAFHLIVPTFFVVLAVVSWALRPDSRTLGVIFPASPTPAIGFVDNQTLPVPR